MSSFVDLPVTGQLPGLRFVQEFNTHATEMRALLAAAGVAPDPAKSDQLATAIKGLIGNKADKATTLTGYGIAVAGKAESEAGTDNTMPMTPLRTAQALQKSGIGGDAVSVSDCNAATGSGIYQAPAGASNAPASGSVVLIHTRQSANAATQLAISAAATYFRVMTGSAWSAWVEVTSKNALDTAIATRARVATVSTAAPSGGADGDVWYQV